MQASHEDGAHVGASWHASTSLVRTVAWRSWPHLSICITLGSAPTDDGDLLLAPESAFCWEERIWWHIDVWRAAFHPTDSPCFVAAMCAVIVLLALPALTVQKAKKDSSFFLFESLYRCTCVRCKIWRSEERTMTLMELQACNFHQKSATACRTFQQIWREGQMVHICDMKGATTELLWHNPLN